MMNFLFWAVLGVVGGTALFWLGMGGLILITKLFL